jgi:dihydroflavonol-4-reductase
MDVDSHVWSGTPVCVLGGSGFLGTHLVGQLLARGARVRSLSLPTPGAEPASANLECLVGDIRNPDDVRNATAGARFVFNLAGPVGVGPTATKLMSAHLEGVQRVLDVLPAGTRLVHTSSIVAVGATRNGEVLTEDSAFTIGRLRVGYVQAKRAAEELALAGAAAGMDVVAVNPGYLFGPADTEPSVMGRFCTRFWRGRIPFAPAGGMNCVDVRDVAAGHLLAAEKGISGRRYILGGENVTMRQLLAALAAAARFRPRWLPQLPHSVFTAIALCAEAHGRMFGKEPFPSLEHARSNRLFWFGSSARAQSELGYRARPLCEALSDAFAWHTARGPLVPRGLKRWWFRPPPDGDV